MADIEDLDQDEEDNDPIVDINKEANVNSITVNKIPIGKACSPYEVIQVQTSMILDLRFHSAIMKQVHWL